MAISLAVEAAINAKWGGVDSTNHPAQTAGVAFIIVHIRLYFDQGLSFNHVPRFFRRCSSVQALVQFPGFIRARCTP
jgi:hypothetical protein